MWLAEENQDLDGRVHLGPRMVRAQVVGFLTTDFRVGNRWLGRVKPWHLHRGKIPRLLAVRPNPLPEQPARHNPVFSPIASLDRRLVRT